MNNQQTRTLSVNAAYGFGHEHGLGREMREIAQIKMPGNWPYSYTTTVRRGYIIEAFEKAGIFAEFKRKHWAVGNTPAGETMRKRFLRLKEEHKKHSLKEDR